MSDRFPADALRQRCPLATSHVVFRPHPDQQTGEKRGVLPLARRLRFCRSMLQATVLESTADLLACRPDIGSLLQEDGITDDLTRLAPPRRPGLWAMGHLLTYAAGGPCGLVSLYAVAHSPRTLVLGPMTGRLVVGKRRTLAALAIMRHLAAYTNDWDELLIAGGGPESRRFDTAARSCRMPRRLVTTPSAIEPLLAISSSASWRSRWRFRSAGDVAISSHWRVDSWLSALEEDIAFSQLQAEHRGRAESIMMQPPTVAFDRDASELTQTSAIPAATRPDHPDDATTRRAARRLPPHLRVISSDDE